MKTTLVWILIGALVISNAVLSLLFLTDTEQPTTGQNAVRDVFADQESATEKETVAVATARQEQLETADTQPTTYESKTSQFALELAPEYVVVVEKDGGANELKSTILKLARRGDNPASVSLGADDFVTIEAYPTKTNGTRDQFIAADTALQGNSAKESEANIDGTPARKFVLEGVGETIKFFFERGDITYHIEAWDVSSGDTRRMVDDAVRGFSFL